MPATPFQALLLQVRDAEEARGLLTEALVEGNRDELVGGDYPFDLDLAGMLFPVYNRGQRPDESAADRPANPDRLGRIFADAAWEMCLEGLLRPGPYSPLDKTSHTSSGYCLTERGRRVLFQEMG